MAMGLDPLDDDGAFDPAAELDAWRARLRRADASASWSHPRHGAPYRAKLQIVYEVDPLDNVLSSMARQELQNLLMHLAAALLPLVYAAHDLDPRGQFERDPLAEREVPRFEMVSEEERKTEAVRRDSLREQFVEHVAVEPDPYEPGEVPISAASAVLDRERKSSYEAGLAAGAERGVESALALVRGARIDRYHNGFALAAHIEDLLNANL